MVYKHEPHVPPLAEDYHYDHEQPNETDSENGSED